jgi:hypothetical protein
MMQMRRAVFHLFLLLILLPSAFGQELLVGPSDIAIEQRADGGFHLYIRKKADTGSVLLTESTRDPNLRAANYAYRAPEWNEVNGDEVRLLDGRPIPRESRIYSLVDSTPERHPALGEAFHIYIPYILKYGYDWTRHGEVYVTAGAYLNIRAFALPYADYRGAFRDNPFVLNVTQRPLPGPPEGNYMKEAEASFADIAKNGEFIHASGPSDLVDKIESLLRPEAGNELDLVLCLDATGSMKDDIDKIREELIPRLEASLADFRSFRIGMVLYKDYGDEYLTRRVEFTEDFSAFQKSLNAIRPAGGRDIPEAVYEALYEGETKFDWRAESRLIILIGDAPPHIRQRGRISKEMVEDAAAEKNLKVHAILLPQ